MIALSIDADISAGTDLLGKSVTDLQTGIEITGNVISGTLKYVTGYTGFSGDPEEQEGNFLALHVDTNATSGTVEIIPGNVGHPVPLDMSDGLIIGHISSNEQVIKIVVTKDGGVQVREFTLDLTLNES